MKCGKESVNFGPLWQLIINFVKGTVTVVFGLGKKGQGTFKYDVTIWRGGQRIS